MVGRQATDLRQHKNHNISRLSCPGCDDGIAIYITLLVCSCYDSGKAIDFAKGLLETQQPHQSTTAARSAISVQMFPKRTEQLRTTQNRSLTTHKQTHAAQHTAECRCKKVQELRGRLATKCINMRLIQETKLADNDDTLTFSGHNPFKVGLPTQPPTREGNYSPWSK